MTDSPPARLAAAMPGTVAELSARTGINVEVVYKLIGVMRRDGTRVRAVMDPSVPWVPEKAQPEADCITTKFVIDTPPEAR